MRPYILSPERLQRSFRVFNAYTSSSYPSFRQAKPYLLRVCDENPQLIALFQFESLPFGHFLEVEFPFVQILEQDLDFVGSVVLVVGHDVHVRSLQNVAKLLALRDNNRMEERSRAARLS